jgi:hypothetical protein
MLEIASDLFFCSAEARTTRQLFLLIGFIAALSTENQIFGLFPRH